MNKLFGTQYNYLQLQPQLAEQVQHSDSYIRQGTGKDSQRKIFYGVPYDQYEVNQLQNLKQALQQNNLNVNYSDDGFYRFMYSHRFQIDKIVTCIKNHEDWLKDPQTFTLTPKATEILEKGVIYISSRDRLHRPLIQINAYLLDPKKFDAQDFLAALSTVLMIAQQYMFYPGKVENWIIFIETNDIGLFNFPFGVLGKIIEMASQHFPGCLEKIYIMNPSTTLKFSWSIIEAFIDERSRKKISFFKKSEFSKLKEYFEPEMLEETYSGKRPKPTQYWPPPLTIPGIVGQYSQFNQLSQSRVSQHRASSIQQPQYLQNQNQFQQDFSLNNPYSPYKPNESYQGYQRKYAALDEDQQSKKKYTNQYNEIMQKYDIPKYENTPDTQSSQHQRQTNSRWKSVPPRETKSLVQNNYSNYDPQLRQSRFNQNQPLTLQQSLVQDPRDRSPLERNQQKSNQQYFHDRGIHKMMISRSSRIQQENKIPVRDTHYAACFIF